MSSLTQSNPAELLAWANENTDLVVRLEPREDYDSAIVAIGYRFNSGPMLVYDIQTIIKMHMDEGLSYDEAMEFFDFNTLGAWLGEGTPMFVNHAPWDFPETLSVES